MVCFILIEGRKLEVRDVTYDVQLLAPVVNGHVPSFAEIESIGEQLVHELFEREAAVLKYASLAVLSKDHVGWVEGGSRADCYAFFAG